MTNKVKMVLMSARCFQLEHERALCGTADYDDKCGVSYCVCRSKAVNRGFVSETDEASLSFACLSKMIILSPFKG